MNFKSIENEKELKRALEEILSRCENDEKKEEVSEMLFGYAQDGVDFALSVWADCLVIRIYDEEYLFMCPMALNQDASVSDAADEVRRYAIREEIPITFIDVTSDELPLVCEPFRFCESIPMDDEGEIFAVKPLTEIGKIAELPTLSGTKATLTPIYESDIADFARLSRDENTNRHFGYNYKEDYADATDGHFYDVMKYEEDVGLAACFAIRCDGEFAGEASLFGFDYLGGASVAIRLLPEFYGRGLGSEAMSLMLDFARNIDIKSVETPIKKANASSIRMTEKYMKYIRDEDDAAIFRIDF